MASLVRVKITVYKRDKITVKKNNVASKEDIEFFILNFLHINLLGFLNISAKINASTKGKVNCRVLKNVINTSV
ncbi:hypothetical protein SDC9_157248 [bioreactor metagenome]|uniref:Uncharacterized protein n=1 Tax=bioreactor metagenome TaxID=1076179 RepID=A0A645F6G4_9ZZZZ